MSKFGEKIKLTSYDELLGVNTESEGTKELDINLLREFKIIRLRCWMMKE